MSRSYKDDNGDVIILSEKHIDVAIDIKMELQKSSPSSRCSWAKHKKMMEIEGFYDSDKNEGYRQLIKYEQSKRGLLPEVEKYAEMVSDNKLESIRAEIGEINEAKLSARLDFLKLNKLKRELNKDVMLIDELRKNMSCIEIDSKPFKPIYVDRISKKDIVVALTDIHFGAEVDIEGYVYSPEIAKEVLDDYANKIISEAEIHNTETIHIVGLGDMVESTYMRHSQPYGVSMTFSEQISGVSELLINFIEKLSEYAKVTYAGINGNHDRMSSKNDTIFSDGAVNIINSHIKLYATMRSDRFKYIETEPYHHIKQINGKNFIFVHGDTTPIKKQSILQELSTLYNCQFDAVFAGHIHHFTMREVGYDKFVVTFGSIKGSDEYSLKQIGSASSRSQGIIIVDEDGEFEIKKIKL